MAAFKLLFSVAQGASASGGHLLFLNRWSVDWLSAVANWQMVMHKAMQGLISFWVLNLQECGC